MNAGSTALRGLRSFRAFGQRVRWGAQKLRSPSRNHACRLQSTSTMELVEEYEAPSVNSTLQYSASTDIAYEAADSFLQPEFAPSLAQEHWNALRSAASARQTSMRVLAQDMDLLEAARMRHAYDKVLILVKHGQDESQVTLGNKDDSSLDARRLTGRGMGQTLDASRRVATFMNDETGLLPELIVVAPMRPAVEAAMRIFPHYHDSVRAVPWLCHADAKDFDDEEGDSIVKEPSNKSESLLESKQKLLQRSDNFLKWVRSREEEVIVVSSQATWLQAFGCSMHYDGASEMFGNGELRALGINFL